MYAIVAQLDRAFGSDPEGQRFESSRSHQEKPEHIRVLVFLFSVRREDSSYPFLFFIQMRYSPSVMRVSRYRMGVWQASRMAAGRLPVA